MALELGSDPEELMKIVVTRAPREVPFHSYSSADPSPTTVNVLGVLSNMLHGDWGVEQNVVVFLKLPVPSRRISRPPLAFSMVNVSPATPARAVGEAKPPLTVMVPASAAWDGTAETMAAAANITEAETIEMVRRCT